MRIPRAYFDAVKSREPRRLEKATESLIFKRQDRKSHHDHIGSPLTKSFRSVEIYERFNPSTLKRLEPPERFLSCDLRVLETTTREGWRTTRRLVISSSAAEKKPWLVESCKATQLHADMSQWNSVIGSCHFWGTFGKLTGHSPTTGGCPDSAGKIIQTNAHPMV